MYLNIEDNYDAFRSPDITYRSFYHFSSDMCFGSLNHLLTKMRSINNLLHKTENDLLFCMREDRELEIKSVA